MKELSIEKKKRIYSDLCEYIDEYTATMNPCGIKVESIGGTDVITCIAYPNSTKQSLLCCKGDEKAKDVMFRTDCKHHCITGCKVQALSCRLWFCETAWNNIIDVYNYKNAMEHKDEVHTFVHALQYVEQMCRLYFIPTTPRFSKKENFERLKKLTK